MSQHPRILFFCITNSSTCNPSSGTFDIAKMDMRWAKPITDNWKKREQRIKTAKAKEAKQKISKLDGYTIEVYDLGNGEKLFIIKKGEKIISRKSKPDLYDILDDYKDYLPKERAKVKKLKIMKFEAPLIVPAGKGIDLIGKIGQISQGLGNLGIGKDILDKINDVTVWQANRRVKEIKDSKEKLPQQGLVTGGVEGAPPVDAGKQGKHQEGHRNNEQSLEDKSTWIDGENGVRETQEAWQKGDWADGREGTVKEYDSGEVVGSDGVTTEIVVHIDGKGNIHGYPKIPKEIRGGNLMNANEQAINFVKRSLKEGDYGYVLRKYVYSDEWDEHLLKNMEGIVFKPSGSFDYTRCFSYMFMEDIKLSNPFFTIEAKNEVMERGYIEYIGLKISAISPFFTLRKAQYQKPKEGITLDIIDLTEFKNKKLEKKYTELIEVLTEQKLILVNREELKKVPLDIPLENYEPEEVTYLSYLFE
ncbi:hypothetical protein [Enterococcus rivorum]|uniref:hypothetical protein n=1 Tax=Enterococcus rivorum TaxID=762845 RepID=UPI001B809047|nr:hypothetical protein [Enterococcus rivorum]